MLLYVFEFFFGVGVEDVLRENVEFKCFWWIGVWRRISGAGTDLAELRPGPVATHHDRSVGTSLFFLTFINYV